jgi:putative SOS response-associated peptidase YedK
MEVGALNRTGRRLVRMDRRKGHKQPWYIRLKTDRPMFLAAITNPKPGEESIEGRGFVIVTAAADGGMVDVHDRRLVVFSPDDAALWMDNTLAAEQAEQLARNMSLPTEAFEWYQVSTDVNQVGNNDEHLIQPMQPI